MAILNIDRTLTLSIENCARCGSSHHSVVAEPLDNSDQFTHWVMCPNSDQPILIKNIDDSDVNN